MKIEPEDFIALVDRAMQNAAVSHMRPVIEKELLHYDILFCLDREGLLDQLVFQGGTSLRLCHGGSRFSEDLDFAGGRDFSSHHLTDMKQCIEDYIGARYGLEVSVREPGSLRQDPKYAELRIDKWQVAIVTAPERKGVPKQRIKIEVAGVPAYTRTPLPLRNNYDFLPDGYEDTLIYTETLSEVMADKLVALPATQKYVRHRDLWDLTWLLQQGASLDADLVANKLADYRITNFEPLLEQRIQSLPGIVASSSFTDEMRRFLPADVFERTLAKEKFTSYLVNTLQGLLGGLREQLYGHRTQGPEFVM